MQRYWWPGYEMQLLGGLQKQQNSTQFCDTLLQTEGISVPTHSCVLAALSPYLSQKLSASPSPPSGQKHQLQLQAVKAQTLLKLVGLLYSGELEVKGSAEQNDVLAVARQFGIAGLVEGQKNGGMKELELQEKRKSRRCCRENGFQAGESRTMQDAQVQAEMAGERDTDSLSEKRSCVSTGSQTVNAGEKSVDGSVILSSQATPQTQESAPSVAQILDCSVLLQHQGITLDKQFCSTSCPVIPSLSNGTPSDGESPSNQSCGSVRNPTSTPAWSSDILTFPISLNNGSKSSRPEEDSTYQQPVEFGDSTQALAEERTVLENGKRNGKTADNRRDAEESRHANRDKMPGEERGKSSEERDAHANVGMKNLAKVQQMMETTQISIKVKLRRRTKGEVWEVVNMQDTDETSSILSSLKQNGSNHKRPETDLSDVPPPPSTVQPITAQKPDSCILQPAATNSPKLPPHLNTPSDSQPPYSNCFTPNQHDGLEAAPLLQHQGSAEESDEHIEKLLEDIMMGLNILPNLERDCMKSKHLQPSHGRVPTICQVPVTQKDMGHSQVDAPVSAAGCVFHQGLGTQSCSSSTDTAHNQPGCYRAAALIHQQQELSPQHHSSVRPMWHRDGVIHQSTPLSKSQECLHPETPTTRSVIPSAFFSAEQELHYPAFQEPPLQNSQHILEFSPLTNRDETESIHTFSLPCMDDLQLPRCLSPLESCPSATKPQPVLNNLDDQVQQKPSPQGRPWLTEKPGSVQFPLSPITERKSKSVSQDARHSRWSKQEHLDLKAQIRGTGAESCAVKKVEERSTVYAGQQNSTELQSDPREVKEGDITGDVIPPKRRRTKCTCHPQDAACSLLPFKDVKVSDSTKSQISRSVCQVSLSSNNVLVKERAMATSSLYCPSKFVGKPNQQSPITESLREKTGGSGVKTYPTRIRTRGFLKKNQESPWDASTENVWVAKPIVHRVQAENIPGVTSRKRGRRSKRKLEEHTPLNISPVVAEKKNHSGESQQTMDNNLAKEHLDKTKQTCKKRWINRSTEVEVIPVKKTTSVESTGKSEADTDIIPKVRKHGTSEQPQMVSLKVQHSKTKRSNKSQETIEGEEMANRDSTWKEPPKEIEVDRDITQPRDRGGSEQSQLIVSVTVDKNNNQIFNESTDVSKKSQQDDTDGSAGMEKSSLGGEDHLEFSFDVVDKEVARLAADREQPLENPDEGTTCDTGVSNTSQQTAANDEGSSHSDIHLPQENKLPSDHNVHLQKPERTGPPLSDTGGISRTSGYHQEEEEEEEVDVEVDVEVEDVEVDVLLYSPDKVPQTRGCEDGLSNSDLTPDEEEEEEDVIDVTGDEEE